MLVEEIRATADKRPWSGYWGSSVIGGCQRGLFLQATSSHLSLDGEASVMSEGHLHEADMVNRLLARGFSLRDVLDNQKEYFLNYDGIDWPVVCHPDGLLELNQIDYLLEFKSMDYGPWGRLGKMGIDAFPRHVAQIQVGMAVTGTESAFYIAKCRPNGRLREQIVRIDHDYIRWLLYDHLKPVMDALASGHGEEALDCHSDESIRNYCPFRHMCQQAVKPIVIDDEEVIAAVATLKEVAPALKSLEAQSDAARKVIKKWLTGTKEQRAVLDGVVAQIISGTRTTLDKEGIAERLGDDYARYLKTSNYTQLRVDIPEED